MAFPQFFSSKKVSDTVVVGGQAIEAKETSMPRSRAFLWITALVMAAALCLSLFFTGALLRDREGQWQVYFQLLESKQTEQQNLDALELLLTQLDTIEIDQALFERALPVDQHYEQVVHGLEKTFRSLQQDAFVELPELISWRPVAPSEVSNGDLYDLGIYQYQFAFLGDYEALMRLFAELRAQQRLVDVRSIRNFKLHEGGLVSADLSLWAYHLNPF